MITKFVKWWENKGFFIFKQKGYDDVIGASKAAWNEALNKVISLTQRRNKSFEGSW